MLWFLVMTHIPHVSEKGNRQREGGRVGEEESGDRSSRKEQEGELQCVG